MCCDSLSEKACERGAPSETEKEPVLVKVGEYVVKVGYMDCEETLDDRMRQYIEKKVEKGFGGEVLQGCCLPSDFKGGQGYGRKL